MDTYFDAYCGLCCRDCHHREADGCGGCIASGGQPFRGVCAVARCARSRDRRFCGECWDFPCELLKSCAYDPEHGDGGRRIENCRAVKTALVARSRAGTDPVGVCGHHCDHCFMGQWCGGCRSDYNCCSFATLFPEGVCPNVRCAGEKGLDGCWDCPELDGCERGFYGRDQEYAAKAAALFIRKYGKTAYGETLRRAIQKGLAYAKDLDDAGSVENALALLERFRGTV